MFNPVKEILLKLNLPDHRYQVYQGRLLASFQDDAKYEHVGQDTRSQGGKDDQDKQGKDLKISDIKTKSKDNDKGSRSKITKHEGTSLQRRQRQRSQELNDNSNLIDLTKDESDLRLPTADEGITLVNVQDDVDNKMFDVNALNGEEVFVAGQNENVIEEVVDVAYDKGKGIMIEEPVKPMKKKDQIGFDEEVALKLQADFDEEERLAREKAKQEANIALIETWDDI
ncbi:hypothetical protein Tco_1501482 [Tanacetum coccineum]